MSKQRIELGDVVINGKPLLDLLHPVWSIFETTDPNLSTPEAVANYFGGTWEYFGTGKVVVGYQSDDNDFKTVANSEQTAGVGGSKYLQSHTHAYTPEGTVSTSLSLTKGTLQSAAHSHNLMFKAVKPNSSESIGNSYSPADAHAYLSFGSDSNDSDRGQWYTAGGNAYYLGDATYMYYNNSGLKIESGGGAAVSGTPGGTATSSFAGSSGTTSSSGSGEAQNLQPYIVAYRYRRIA